MKKFLLSLASLVGIGFGAQGLLNIGVRVGL